ncbi:MAG: hypothetical protein L0229_04710 [Blastocatellia bacterium]|nr:hypothetical protein [Blastocatellia bacterium]
MEREHPLTGNNILMLKQGLELLDGLPGDLYAAVNPPLFDYGVGAHFRHCLDSYTCFLKGIESGRINYDLRERDERVERDRSFAIAKIEATIDRLHHLPATEASVPLVVKMESAVREKSLLGKKSLCDGEQPLWAHSSLARELQFLMSHTVHHYAIVAVLLRFQGFEPGKGFGVAPSTLEHWRNASQEERNLEERNLYVYGKLAPYR